MQLTEELLDSVQDTTHTADEPSQIQATHVTSPPLRFPSAVCERSSVAGSVAP